MMQVFCTARDLMLLDLATSDRFAFVATLRDLIYHLHATGLPKFEALFAVLRAWPSPGTLRPTMTHLW